MVSVYFSGIFDVNVSVFVAYFAVFVSADLICFGILSCLAWFICTCHTVSLMLASTVN